MDSMPPSKNSSPFACDICRLPEKDDDIVLLCELCGNHMHPRCDGYCDPLPDFLLSSVHWLWRCMSCSSRGFSLSAPSQPVILTNYFKELEDNLTGKINKSVDFLHHISQDLSSFIKRGLTNSWGIPEVPVQRPSTTAVPSCSFPASESSKVLPTSSTLLPHSTKVSGESVHLDNIELNQPKPVLNSTSSTNSASSTVNNLSSDKNSQLGPRSSAVAVSSLQITNYSPTKPITNDSDNKFLTLINSKSFSGREFRPTSSANNNFRSVLH